jgi:hypothetical protein
MRYDLKSLLVRRGLATQERVDWATEMTRGTDGNWLEHLVSLALVDEEKVCECVSTEVCVPRCDPLRLANLSHDVLGRIPSEVAVEYRALPVLLEPDGDLRVVMMDPLDQIALEEIEFFAGRRILREVVIATALGWAMHNYYGLRTALWPRGARRPHLVVDHAEKQEAAETVTPPEILRALGH